MSGDVSIACIIESWINRYKPSLDVQIGTGLLVAHRGLVASVAGVLRRDARALNQCGQATKGVWGMSWRQEAMKGVEVCEKSGGVDKRALIPEFPNCRALNT